MYASRTRRVGASADDRFAPTTDGTMLRLGVPGHGDEPDIASFIASQTGAARRRGVAARCAYDSERAVRRICGVTPSDGVALAAWHGGTVVALAEFHGVTRGQARVALSVDEAWTRRGAGSVLVRHLLGIARCRGVRSWVADHHADNALLFRTLLGMGLPVLRRRDRGIASAVCPLVPAKGAAV